MTKKEFIERMIELYKKGEDTRHLRMCAGFECNECPAHKEDDNCYSDELLIDEIIRLKRETNLEHYTKETGLVALEGKDYMEVTFMLPKETRTALEYQGAWNWLLSPHEEPKRYQMPQLYHDMIAKWLERYEDGKITRSNVYKFIDVLFDMGIFFDYDDEIKDDIEALKTLLENAEVVE